MRISFIATIFNEEKTIEVFLTSVLSQSILPDEIKVQNYNVKFKIIVKRGNRSVGRNEAITHARGDIIVCSDAGCELDKDWIKHITKPFKDMSVDVVAGYYKGKSQTIFQKCLIPYVLVMPDRVDLNNFLPATRSMAFKKITWKKTGGFPENFSHNEDYVFARHLKKINAKIFFEKKAIAYWKPPVNVLQAYTMFFRFAYGDAEAGIVRPKVLLLFTRYLLFFIVVLQYLVDKNPFLLQVLLLWILLYIVWSIKKNYTYVKDTKAFFYLPSLQIISDVAVMRGTVFGALHIPIFY